MPSLPVLVTAHHMSLQCLHGANKTRISNDDVAQLGPKVMRGGLTMYYELGMA